MNSCEHVLIPPPCAAGRHIKHPDFTLWNRECPREGTAVVRFADEGFALILCPSHDKALGAVLQSMLGDGR